MKLQGVRDTDYIDFDPQKDVSEYTFMVTAALGDRTVHDDLPLLGVASFCSVLQEFAVTGRGEPVLEGPYDFRLALRSDRGDNSIWAEFYMAKFIMQDDSDYGRLALSGGFSVSPPALLAFADAFLAHFSHEPIPKPSA